MIPLTDQEYADALKLASKERPTMASYVNLTKAEFESLDKYLSQEHGPLRDLHVECGNDRTAYDLVYHRLREALKVAESNGYWETARRLYETLVLASAELGRKTENRRAEEALKDSEGNDLNDVCGLAADDADDHEED